MLQNGEIYTKTIIDEKRTQEGNVSKLGMGILKHTVFQLNNQSVIVKGNFAPKDELEIL